MSPRDWFQPPRSLLTLYVAGAVLALGCVGWLAARQLHQDDIVTASLESERLQNVARAAALESTRVLAELADAARGLAGPPPHTHVVQVREDGVTSRKGTLPFLPVGPPTTPVPPGVFEGAEHLEQVVGDYGAAAALYQSLADSPHRAVQAGAVMRLARTHLRQGRPREALDAWTRLATFPDVVAEGRPVDLVAALGRLRALDALGRKVEAGQEARSVVADLSSGRWPLTWSVWRAAADDAARWIEQPTGGVPDTDAMSAAEALTEYWPSRADAGAGEAVAIEAGGGLAVVVPAGSTGVDENLLVAGPAFLTSLGDRLAPAGMSVRLLAPDSPHDPSAPGTLAVQATALPWVIVASDRDPSGTLAAARRRRTMFLVTLGLAAALIVASGYFTLRGIRRELAMAQQQADFVSAVSHEFRTPLTSIRQLSHLLRDDRVDGSDRRRQYYSVLVRESERLNRLVERLLSFGRADAGRFHFSDLDAADLARTVVDEFRPQATGRTIDVSTPSAPCRLRGDRDMLALALWNLLDNAVKYSPGRQPIRVAVESRNASVVLAVEDHGHGIAHEDRRHIFDKFVRGSGSAVRDTAGSGLGLALVDRVVRGHGGTIEVASRPGEGSTFTMVFPLQPAGAT